MRRWVPMGGAVAATVLATLLSVRLRAPCSGDQVSLAVATGTGCLGDLPVMWYGRGLRDHLLPYLTTLDTSAGGPGTVEYPVLLGMLMWLLSLPVSTFASFVVMVALAMGACAVGITVILYRSVGAVTWVWVLAPALVQYVTYNFDMAPALCTVAAGALLLRRDPVTIPTGRIVAAAALLSVGGALKLYPLILLGPLCLWLLFGSPGAQSALVARARRALIAAATGVGVFALINLPVALLSWRGWLEPFRFQAVRAIDSSTQSIWFLLGEQFGVGSHGLMQVSTLATALGLAGVLIVSWLVAGRTGTYPLLGSFVAILGAYVVLNKVFSPQYIVWLLPLFLLAGVHLWPTVAYVLLDPVQYWSWFLGIFAATAGQEVVADFWAQVQTACLVVRLVLVVGVGLWAVLGPLGRRQNRPTVPRHADVRSA